MISSQRTGWLQRKTNFPGDFSVQERFEVAFEAQNAPVEFALFARSTPGLKNYIFLLTPAAAPLSSMLGGEWTDAGDPRQHRWSLLVGHADSFTRFGLTSGAD